ncbi:MAG: hypothetical protein O8C66_11480 [Candidatus Methanoperedens sp.]|nr:hypothetical protein [Candidatus Methanoperedens sp.]MCZ7371122.1 hypothetical protein [Candidatus Methanoperedens sp.]
MINNVRPGSNIKSFNWLEPVEIKLIEDTGEYVHIVGATTLSREHIDQIIPAEKFSRILIEGINSAFSAESWKVFLAGRERLREEIRRETVQTRLGG